MGFNLFVINELPPPPPTTQKNTHNNRKNNRKSFANTENVA